MSLQLHIRFYPRNDVTESVDSEILGWPSAQLVFIILLLSIRFYPRNDATESVGSEILGWLSA